MDKLTEMTVFSEVARQGSFSAAAAKLRLSPSAVSKLITRMEARLGSRLLNRTTRKLSLTEGGQLFLNRCLAILEQVDDAEELLTGYYREPKGKLRVTSSPGFAKHQLLPLIPDFLAQYPAVEIDLQLTGQTIDLISGEIDLAIRLGNLNDSSHVARKLGESRRIICASPAYLANNGIPQTPDELEAHNCLTTSTSTPFNQWRFHTKKGEKTLSISGNFSSDTVDSLHDLALRGAGIVRLAKFMVGQDIKQGLLIPLLEDYNRELQPVHAVYAHRDHLPAKVSTFINFLLSRDMGFSG